MPTIIIPRGPTRGNAVCPRGQSVRDAGFAGTARSGIASRYTEPDERKPHGLYREGPAGRPAVHPLLAPASTADDVGQAGRRPLGIAPSRLLVIAPVVEETRDPARSSRRREWVWATGIAPRRGNRLIPGTRGPGDGRDSCRPDAICRTARSGSRPLRTCRRRTRWPSWECSGEPGCGRSTPRRRRWSGSRVPS